MMRKILRVLLTSYLFYLLISFLIINPVMYFGLTSVYQSQTGRVLSYRFVGFNPFVLSVFLINASDNNEDGSTFWGVEDLTVNLSLQSLKGVPVFDDISIEGLEINPVINQAGNWNFEKVLKYRASRSTEKAAEEKKSTAVDMEIRKFSLASKKVSFNDFSHPEKYEFQVDHIALQAQGFSTVSSQDSSYQFSVHNRDGGELSVSGDLSVHDDFTELSFDLQCFDLKTAWRYFKPSLDFLLKKGCVSTKGKLNINWTDQLSYQLDVSRFLLENVDIEKNEQVVSSPFSDTLTFDEMSVADIKFDSQTRLLDVATVNINSLDLKSSSKGGEVSLQEMFAVNSSKKNAETTSREVTVSTGVSMGQPVEQLVASSSEKLMTVGNTQEPPDDSEAELRVNLDKIQINDARIAWYFNELDGQKFDFTINEFEVSDANWPPHAPLNLLLKTEINRQAKLSVDADINLDTLGAVANVEAGGIPLFWFNPLVQKNINARIDSGALSTQTHIEVVEGDDVLVNMGGEISNLMISEVGNKEATQSEIADISTDVGSTQKTADLLGWKKMQWQDVSLDIKKQHYDLGEITVNGVNVFLKRDQYGQLNISTLLNSGSTDDDGMDQPGLSEQQAASQIKVTSGKFEIIEGNVSIVDQAVSPAFTLQMQELGVVLSGNNKSLKADIESKLNGYAPLAIGAEFNDIFAEKNGHLDVSVNHFDMGSLSVYSGEYLGWNIDQGQLNYKMAMQKTGYSLKGNNYLLLDQFQWGKKVDSDKVVDIPIKTATALFRSVDGKIELDVPVEGDTNSPDFRIGKIVLTAFGNLFVKSLASPFTLLASIVDTNEDLAEIAFQAGSASIDEPGLRKLHHIAIALEKRPSINLGLQGSYDLQSDALFLKRKALEKSMLEAGLSEEDILVKKEAWQNFVSRSCQIMIEKEPEKHAACMSGDVEQKYRAIEGAQKVAPEQLQSLAQSRVSNVKAYLLDRENVLANRLFIQGELSRESPGVNLQINY